ncbi:hypothetical protein HPP92_015273 [Vanilla planifolia]|uniref:Uncharacterized protein n=1 Tax=Vanilla planifolia TaxID=51239 RepID=A0A835QM05_VANPL|nr:hypothetical protein HPP92_015273 [Vanilla planifolia]
MKGRKLGYRGGWEGSPNGTAPPPLRRGILRISARQKQAKSALTLAWGYRTPPDASLLQRGHVAN